MEICILGNQARATYLFWRVLMRRMRDAGHSVFCLLPPGDDATEQTLRGELDVDIVHFRLDRKGVNPIHDIATFLDLQRILGERRPDLLFATTIKPVIYGCLAAKRVGIPHIYATITGLGYAFEADTFFKKCVNRLSIFLYHRALHGIEGVFFQNRDDATLFSHAGILDASSRVLFARGTGVDTGHFAPAPLPGTEDGFVFLMVGRLLEAKGYRDYVEAAKLLAPRFPGTHFRILGPREQGLGSIGDEELASWQEEGVVEYLGEASDVRPHLSACHVLVLPSWREGTPTSVMEAMSTGRAAIVSDVPGCREVVHDGVNGLLVPARDPLALAGAMERFLANPSLAATMGARGRAVAVDVFDAQVVASGILADMSVPAPAKEPQHD